MIECRSLSVKNILSDISFKVNKGELCVIIGKNGSGKTTLFRAICSNIRYDGDLIVDGRPLKEISSTSRARMIASMPQNLPEPAITVKRLVEFGRQPYTGISGILSEGDKAIVKRVMKESGISHISQSLLTKISGGERRISYFAMMLAQQAPLMLCDEPTANLDAEHQKHILELLKDQKTKGNTVLCVLHNINQAIEIADRILLIDSGRLIFDGSPKELVEKKIPEEHFGLTVGNHYE